MKPGFKFIFYWFSLFYLFGSLEFHHQTNDFFRRIETGYSVIHHQFYCSSKLFTSWHKFYLYLTFFSFYLWRLLSKIGFESRIPTIISPVQKKYQQISHLKYHSHQQMSSQEKPRTDRRWPMKPKIDCRFVEGFVPCKLQHTQECFQLSKGKSATLEMFLEQKRKVEARSECHFTMSSCHREIIFSLDYDSWNYILRNFPI